MQPRQLFIEDPFAEPTGYWWVFMTTASVINILLAIVYLIYIRNQTKTLTSKTVIVFGLIYIVVCAWRSIFPVVNTDRRCFWDTDFATPVVSRSIATVAETGFIAIFSILYIKIFIDLCHIEGTLRTIVIVKLKLLVPIIIVAQILAWLGVSTQNNLYNAIEVIIWTAVFAFLLVLSILTLCLYKPDRQSVVRLLAATAMFSTGFVGFEVIVDIPRYFADLAANPENFTSFEAGVVEMGSCQQVTRLLEDWENDIPWQTGYFTFGVWWCMMLVVWNQKYDVESESAPVVKPTSHGNGVDIALGA